MRFLSSLAVLAVLAVPVAASASSVNLSTGTATYYVQQPIAPPNTRVAVSITPNPGWGANITGASWIGLPDSGSTSYPGGLYNYVSGQSFTGFYTLKGSFASDNGGGAYLMDLSNGNLQILLAANMYGTNPSNYSFNVVTPFTAALNPSHNYQLVFQINNGNGTTDTSGPTGLLAGAVASTPEPSSLALLGTGVLSAAGMARRRFRKA